MKKQSELYGSHSSFILGILQNTAFSSATRLFCALASLSVSRLLPFLSSSPILSIFLSSSSILIMLYFRPSRLRPPPPPPPVLLHPRPPNISSSTHPLHQTQAAVDDARSATVSEAVDRFLAAIGRTLPVVAATLLLLLHPLLFLFFFFKPLRQSKKKKPLYRVG